MPIGSLTPSLPPTTEDRRLHQAAEAMEALLLKQIIRSSGAFGGGESAGSGIRADLFADTLADAVAHTGGIGIAAELERTLGRGAVPTAPAPVIGGVPSRPSLPSSPAFSPPVAGAHLTSGFGARSDPLTGLRAIHHGFDLAAPEGTSIAAAAPGVVKSVGERGHYGLSVEIDHGNGMTTLYGHASELLVREGETISAGQPIARVGHTGRSTGPHLHFELRDHGQPIDPSRALKVYGRRAEEIGERSPLAAARTL